VTDDERGKLTLLNLRQRRGDALLLVRERLAAGNAKRGIARDEGGEGVGRLRAHVSEAAIGPLARIGLHQPLVLPRSQARAARDHVGGFAARCSGLPTA